jgi:hypothetical protein
MIRSSTTIVSAVTTWPSRQCGQATATLSLRTRANLAASVSIPVVTSCDVSGHR